MIESLKRPPTGSEAAENIGKDMPELPVAANLSPASAAFSRNSLAWLSTGKAALCGLMILTAYAALRSAIAAVLTPFWYDEIITWTMARRPHVSDLWQALQHGADGNPPGLYLIERMTSHWILNDQIAFRLPSIFGFCCVLVCLFVFVKRRSGAGLALGCTAALLLTPFYDTGLYAGLVNPYAIDARPYSLVAACISIALVCYQEAPVMPWMMLMGVSLAAAEALHYYAVFALVPFGLAEATVLLKTRQLRWSVWLALASGVLPLAAFWPLLSYLRQSYGSHFWSQPSLLGAIKTYGLLLGLSSALGVGILGAVVYSIGAELRSAFPQRAEASPLQEYVLVLGLLSLPVVGLFATKLSHGGMNARYVLPALLAFPVAASYVLRRLGGRTITFYAVLLVLSVGFQEVNFWRSHSRKFSSPTNAVTKLITAAGYPDLPVVFSHGYSYLPAVHYATPDWRGRFVILQDAQKAISYTGADTIEWQTNALRPFLGLQVYGLASLTAEHPAFLLYSRASDWWPADLLREGYSLRLVAGDQAGKVYLVNTKKVD